MRPASLLLTLAIFAALAVCAGCSDSLYMQVKTIGEKTAVVQEIQFHSGENGRAVTQLRVADESGATMGEYALIGFYPTIKLGSEVEIKHVYRYLYENDNHGEFFTFVCVNDNVYRGIKTGWGFCVTYAGLH